MSGQWHTVWEAENEYLKAVVYCRPAETDPMVELHYCWKGNCSLFELLCDTVYTGRLLYKSSDVITLASQHRKTNWTLLEGKNANLAMSPEQVYELGDWLEQILRKEAATLQAAPQRSHTAASAGPQTQHTTDRQAQIRSLYTELQQQLEQIKLAIPDRRLRQDFIEQVTQDYQQKLKDLI